MKESNSLKITVLCMGMVLLGGGIAFGFIASGASPQFLTDQDCFALQNESFIIGAEYTIATITNEMVQCKTLPVSYDGYNYTLVAAECLNLTKSEGGNK